MDTEGVGVEDCVLDVEAVGETEFVGEREAVGLEEDVGDTDDVAEEVVDTEAVQEREGVGETISVGEGGEGDTTVASVTASSPGSLSTKEREDAVLSPLLRFRPPLTPWD